MALLTRATSAGVAMPYDVFVCHASVDKPDFVEPLVQALKAAGVSLWYDRMSLEPGDDFRVAITAGLGECRYGLVVLSPAALTRRWPRYELTKILELEEAAGRKSLIPIWHNVDERDVASAAPGLENRKALLSREGIPGIVAAVLRLLSKDDAALVDVKPEPHPLRWSQRRTGVQNSLTSVAFGAGGKAYAVGDAGALIVSDDFGLSWTRRQLETSAPLRCIVISQDLERGWITGDDGVVFRSVDGGATWSSFSLGEDREVSGVAWCDHDTAVCFTIDEGPILRYDGKTLNRVKEQPFEDYPWQIAFDPTGQLGCIVQAAGQVLVTVDAGRQWKPAPWPHRAPIYGCTVRSDRTIWAVGDGGIVCYSPDLGRTWIDVQVLESQSLWDTWLNVCDFSPSGRVGLIGGSQGRIAVSLDGGKSWALARLQDRTELVNVAFQDERSAIAVSYFGAVVVAEHVSSAALTATPI